MSAKGGMIPSDGHMKATTRGIDEMNAGVDNWVEAGYRGGLPGTGYSGPGW